jgi:hypothetical protein
MNGMEDYGRPQKANNLHQEFPFFMGGERRGKFIPRRQRTAVKVYNDTTAVLSNISLLSTHYVDSNNM